jgi:hypothetical protein
MNKYKSLTPGVLTETTYQERERYISYFLMLKKRIDMM